MNSNILSNFPGFAMSQLKQTAAWVYKQDYASLYTRVSDSKEWIMFSCAFLLGYIIIMLMYIYKTTAKAPRANKRKLEEDVFEEQNRHIKRRLSLQAEKYRHASAFQTIQQQVGEDPRSWPVILLNEVILLREDLARVQKKEF